MNYTINGEWTKKVLKNFNLFLNQTK